MLRVERYVFRTAAYAFLAGLTALTGIVWVTQALRQVDLLTSKGQSLLVFLSITGLTTPSLVAIIAPVALFGGVLYCLNKLNGDSELVVMSAAGISPARLLRPFLILFTMVFVLVAALYVEVMPWSFNAIEALSAFIRADFIANFARPGAFNELTSGFIFHFRDRGADGSLHGVFMQDRRDPSHITTYVAEVGKAVTRNDETYLVLSQGTYQRPESSGDSAIVTFDDYAIELSQFTHKGDSVKRPRERATADLLTYKANDGQARRMAGRFRSELVDRLSSPLYAFAAGLIGFAALGEARTTRQGRGLAIAAAVLTFAVLRMLGIAVISLAVSDPRAAVLAWALPIGASALCLELDLRRTGEAGDRRRSPTDPGGGIMIAGTLGRYFARHFFKTIGAVFSGVFALIYAIDVVEMLRRSGDTPGAVAPLMAWLSLLHTPIVAEQALPFAVLFGAMIAFLNLSRKLELVVARSAGVSVWQFIAPPRIRCGGDRRLRRCAVQSRLDGDEAPGRPNRGQVVRRGGRPNGWGLDPPEERRRRIDLARRRTRQRRRNPCPRPGVQFWSRRRVRRAHRRRNRDAQRRLLAPGGRKGRHARLRYAIDRRLSACHHAQPVRHLTGLRRTRNCVILGLPELAQQMRRAGLDPAGYDLKYQELLALPLMLSAMVLVAACFSLRFFRMGGVQKMVSGGVAAGFVLYVATKLVNDLGAAGFFSATVAGWSPAVVGCLLGSTCFCTRRTVDGPLRQLARRWRTPLRRRAGASGAGVRPHPFAGSALAQSAATEGAAARNPDKLVVEANELVYDKDHNMVSAVGGVELYYKHRVLQADRVVYDRTTKRLYAKVAPS